MAVILRRIKRRMAISQLIVIWCMVAVISSYRVTLLCVGAISSGSSNSGGGGSGNPVTSSSLQRQKQVPPPQPDPTPTPAFLQLTETEVWNKTQNAWSGSASSKNRWTNEKGQSSLSPSELSPPEGWDFAGDWKIVVNHQPNSQKIQSQQQKGTTDAMGWEYTFQYLQPPIRRRIWLRSLQPSKKANVNTSVATKRPKKSTAPKSFLQARPILQRIKDEWNFKGYGMSVYKSFIFPESCGVGFRLPLTANLEYFDSRPGLPSLTCGTGFFFPWTIMGFFSCTVHVEWVKWALETLLTLVPRLLVFLVYKVILPMLHALAAAILFPFKHRFPKVPTNIPTGFWTVASPRYNSEISERLGVSVSYRWSKKRGYEFRVNYSHSYLPTFAVYQQVALRTQQRIKNIKKSVLSPRRKSMQDFLQQQSSSSSSSSLSEGVDDQGNAILVSENNDWWQKHFARLGISTSYPIPSPPHFSCTAILSLSGLYFKKQRGTSTAAAATLADHAPNAVEIPAPLRIGKRPSLKEDATSRSASDDDWKDNLPTKTLLSVKGGSVLPDTILQNNP